MTNAVRDQSHLHLPVFYIGNTDTVKVTDNAVLQAGAATANSSAADSS